jgi:4-hydroxy-tetrahydrodipicolinate reductase
MTIRVIVNGANGKMGQITVKTLLNNPDFTVVGQLGRQDNLAAEIKKTNAQVVVDLTTAESAFENTKIIIEANAHPVIGTSGLIADQVHQLQDQCAQKKLGGVIAPNFSIGAVLMMKYAQEFAKYFPEVEIIEMHHNGKLDSPSGTAVRTAELLAAARKQNPNPLKNTRETIPGARGANYQSIPIHAVRLPGLVAHQQILFGGVGETVTIRHDTIDRQCFMSGVVLSCKKALELKELVYGLDGLL